MAKTKIADIVEAIKEVVITPTPPTVVTADIPTEEFYNVTKEDGGVFFSIETVKIQGDKVISREKNDSNYMAVQLTKLKHMTFGKYFFLRDGQK